MFGGMIDETPYDLRWRMFDIRCRIHPLFWVGAAFFSWPWLDIGIPNLFIAIFCVLFSILLHELGHVIVGRIFGSRGEIVLWAMGGLAIGSSQLDNRWKRIAVYAAGPLIQLLLFALLWILLPLVSPCQPGELGILLPAFVPEPYQRPYPFLIGTFLHCMLAINLYWPLLNLLPIYPLDGGQIARDLCTHFSPRHGIRTSLQISIGVAGLLALHAFLAGSTGRSIPYLPASPTSGIFFLVFALFSIQLLQLENSHDNWTEDHRYN